MRAHHQTRSPSRSWKAGLVRQASALLQENDQQNVTLHRSQLSNMNYGNRKGMTIYHKKMLMKKLYDVIMICQHDERLSPKDVDEIFKMYENLLEELKRVRKGTRVDNGQGRSKDKDIVGGRDRVYTMYWTGNKSNAGLPITIYQILPNRLTYQADKYYQSRLKRYAYEGRLRLISMRPYQRMASHYQQQISKEISIKRDQSALQQTHSARQLPYVSQAYVVPREDSKDGQYSGVGHTRSRVYAGRPGQVYSRQRSRSPQPQPHSHYHHYAAYSARGSQPPSPQTTSTPMRMIDAIYSKALQQIHTLQTYLSTMNKTLQEKDNECLTLRKYIEELQISLRSIQMGKDIQSGIVHTHGYSPSFEGKLIDRNIENENRLVEENRLLKLYIQSLRAMLDESSQTHRQSYHHSYPAQSTYYYLQYYLQRANQTISDLRKLISRVPQLKYLYEQGEIIRQDTVQLIKMKQIGMSGNKIEQTNSVLLERLEKEEMAKESFMKDVMLFKQKYKELEEENRVLKEMVEGRKKLGKGEKVEKVDRGQWPQSSRHVRGLQQYEKTVQYMRRTTTGY